MVGQSPASRKKQHIRETATSQSTGTTTPGSLISNGEAVAVEGGTAGNTMMPLDKSLREAQWPTRSLGDAKIHDTCKILEWHGTRQGELENESCSLVYLMAWRELSAK